ncbi:hypothetical protein B0I35DRAFT_6714 [Stachybotrys elegans]|uniref:COP9 signalosome complex subunit 6 n=1 Tax=Stachybotrys elegans TaxID=80388 RepID=A0A8K0WX23_9HYPO|nr:hypothetical protein B0I35DRAFT_6714 [Stachybotrys elegans]
MDSSSSNPLLLSQKSIDTQVVLHPLVLLTISDYITRHTLRQQEGPIIGALLGQQNGREITVEHAFECIIRAVPEVRSGYVIDEVQFSERLEKMTTVHKDRDLGLVGWYTLLPPSGPTPAVLAIHSQIMETWNESPLLLGFHPEEVLHHSVGGKLPLTIYESEIEVDDPKTDQDGEDKKMEDAEEKKTADASSKKLEYLEPSRKFKFREVSYSIETDETEMISMNYIAAGGGNASSAATKDERTSRSVESNGKGKRRLVESELTGSEDAIVLSKEEEEMIASLTGRANAIKMLQSRIRLITTYLERLPPSQITGEVQNNDGAMETDTTTPSLTVLRQIQALVSRLDLVIPSDRDAFERELLDNTNDVNLIGMLSGLIEGANKARDVQKKFAVIESAKSINHRAHTDFQTSKGQAFQLPGGRGAGDLHAA